MSSGADPISGARSSRHRVHDTADAVADAPARVVGAERLVHFLFDQANASRIRARIYSGFGGQTDFTVGASHSPGGRAFMALCS